MFSPAVPRRIPDHTSRNDHERKLTSIRHLRSESAIRSLIRAEFAGLSKYCPRRLADIEVGHLLQLAQCRRDHSESVRRERAAMKRMGIQ